MEEVEALLKSVKTGKSPGLDKLTIEVLTACWEWVGKVYFDVVTAFWKNGIMMAGALYGVIRLVPKGGDVALLKN